MSLPDIIKEYIQKNLTYIQNLAIEICEIPSMTGKEEKKADFIQDKLYKIIGEGVEIDEAGNVKYLYKGMDSSKLLVLTAHIDTVFKDLFEIKCTIKDNLIYGPSIGDNSINVAALILMIKMFKELNIVPQKDILFVFDVGEEGLGNLKGIRKIMKDYGDMTENVIAVDGGYKSVVNTAVGSIRYSVAIKTEGGHSWGAFGNDNAILYASRIIEGLYHIKVPENPKTTYNVGIINGGTSVNTIAEFAEVIFDLRSINKKCLEKLDNEFLSVIDEVRSDKIKIDVKLIGERPAGACDEDTFLIRAIKEVREELKLEDKFGSSSTDANIALDMGIPAVSFGVYEGMGTHTENEHIDVNSFEMGLRHLAGVVLKLV